MRLLLVAIVFLALVPASLAQRVRIGAPENIAVLPLVALEEGFFKEQGLEVEFLPLMTGKISMDSLANGSIDFGCIVDSNVAYISFERTDIKVVGAISVRYDDQLIVNKASASEGKGLKGLRVGYLPATTSQVFLERLLDSKGLQMSDIRPIPLQPPAMRFALAAGSVDGVSIWQPWANQIVAAAKDRYQVFSNRIGLYDSRVFLAVGRSSAENSILISKVVRALIKAEAFLTDNRPKVIELMSRRLGMVKSDVDLMFEGAKFRVQLTKEGVGLVSSIASHLHKSGAKRTVSGGSPEVRRLFDGSFLKSIDSRRVALD